MNRQSLFLMVIVFALLTTATGWSQWSSDPLENLPIADRTGTQIQAKAAPTGHDGCYVSWFDNSTGGYDVYLQRLDSSGTEQWPHNGILIADRSYSSTQDYGLDSDAADNALITYRDVRQGTDQIIANLVSSGGDLLWGPNGVQVSSVAAGVFIAQPVAAVTNDDKYVIGWYQDGETHLMKLKFDGTPYWAGEVVLSDTGSMYFTISDIQAAEAGSVIVSMIREQGFTNPRHILAQKLDASGIPMWGTGPVVVFDGASLQFGNYPDFIPDGAGGGIFCWYTNSNPLQCYAQHIASDGTEVFGHNGVTLSTNASQQRTAPSAAYNRVTGDTYLFWIEENMAQSRRGVYGQKLNTLGERQWTNDGVAVEPVGDDDIWGVAAFTAGDGALAVYAKTISLTTEHLLGAALDSDGGFAWPSELADISTAASLKSSLTATQTASENTILFWSDERMGSQDIYTQNINPDGSLGAPPCVHDGDVDASQDLTPADALLSFQIYMGIYYNPSVGEVCSADCNGDLTVTPADALCIFMHYLSGSCDCTDPLPL